jgi:hypothetical protein
MSKASDPSTAVKWHGLVRFAWAVLGSFVGATGTWIFWGVLTPGDFFANGSTVLPSLVVGGLLGAYTGRIVRFRGRIAFGVAAVLCAAFWSLAPDGWWATPPPRRHVPTPVR